MAKMKTFAVDVEITVKRTLFVTARRPGGAEARILTEEGWSEATRFEEPVDPWVGTSPPKDLRITRVREADF